MKDKTSLGIKILLWILLATAAIQTYTIHIMYLTIGALAERIETVEQRNR
jgi:hypothetical protein